VRSLSGTFLCRPCGRLKKYRAVFSFSSIRSHVLRRAPVSSSSSSCSSRSTADIENLARHFTMAGAPPHRLHIFSAWGSANGSLEPGKLRQSSKISMSTAISDMSSYIVMACKQTRCCGDLLLIQNRCRYLEILCRSRSRGCREMHLPPSPSLV
jgi:hypothetical protein